MNIVEGIQKITRRLGTNINSYLDDFFNTTKENDFIKITNWDDYRNKSLNYNYKKQKSDSNTTIKQLKEFFCLLKFLNEKDEFIIKFKDEKEFKNIIEKKIEEISNNNIYLKQLKFKNIERLYNNIIISNFIEIDDINKLEKNKLINDKVIENKLREFNLTNKISITNLKDALISRAKKIFDQFNIDDSIFKKESNFNISSQVKKVDKNISIEEIRNYINVEVWNIFEFIEKKLLNPTNKLEIPFYQREYVWNETLVEDLLKSIITSETYLNVGSMLIKNNSSHNTNTSSIVDGQQRFTTLLMIINYISKKISKQEELSNSNILENLENKSNDEYIESLKEVFDIDINILGSKKFKIDDQIKINYLKIHNFLSNYNDDDLLNVFEKLRTSFLTIVSDSKSNEIDLFINMNSKRKELSNYDLIRSFLINEINKIDQKEELDDLNKKLNEITELLKFDGEIKDKESNIFFDLFISYINTKNSKKVALDYKMENIFKNIQKIYAKYFEGQISLFIDNVIENLKTYRTIKDIDKSTYIYLDDFKVSLIGKNNLKQSSIYNIFLIEFVNFLRVKEKEIKNEESKKEFYKVLNETRKTLLLLEKFELKWKIFNFNGDSLTTKMRNLFEKLVSKNDFDYNNSYNLLIELIKENDDFIYDVLFNTDDKEIINFKDKIKKDSIIEKILYRVSFNLHNNNSIELSKDSKTYYKIDNPSIEHIFPKKNEEWLKEDENNCKELERYLEDIGNKLIFDRNRNSKIGNNIFLEKIKNYREWNEFKIDKTFSNESYDIRELSSWTTNDIEQRRDFIFDSLIKIWNKYK